MQQADREEFDAQMQRLCAGFGVPATVERIDAFRIGLAKMPLPIFARCIEQLLGESGQHSAKLTVGLIWETRKKMRGAAAPEVKPIAKDSRDHLEFFANRLLYDHISTRRGLSSTGEFVPGLGMRGTVSSAELKACIVAKDALVRKFMQRILGDDPRATYRKFVAAFVKELQAIGHVEETLLTAWRGRSALPASGTVIPRWMARDLQPFEQHQLMPGELGASPP